jgi:glycerol uptake facilitator protein
MSPYLAEFIGTTLLILFGNGVVANVLLAKTKGHGSGWIVISAGWGIAVFIGAFCAEKYSGAHLNPAVTLAMLIAGKTGAIAAIGYAIAQFLGAIFGAFLVYVFYCQHFVATESSDDKLACFCTGANIRNHTQSVICEAIGTYALILPIFLMVAPSLETSPMIPEGKLMVIGIPETKIGLGTLGLLPVGLLVFGIGDLGPRIVHAILPIPGKRDSDWGYAWVPVVGPLLGAALAAGTYLAIVGFA